MHEPLDAKAQRQLFVDARTHRQWLKRDVPLELLQRLYDLMRMGPTSANTCPGRILFVTGAEAKEKLLTAMDSGNVEKTRTAPVTAILAMDMKFHDKLPQLQPHNPEARSWFAGDAELIEETAFRNSSLQGGYLILAARMLGLDCGPMSGFDQEKVDELFFSGTSWKSNFIINLGYGDASALHPRSPRLHFDEACRVI